MNRRQFLAGTAGLCGSAVLVGCGGGSAALAGARGRAALTIQWPERTRLIPQMANSIVAEIYDGLEAIDRVVLTRSGGSLTTTAAFSDLPCKTLDILLQAYPTTDGTGVAQGVAIEALSISAGQTTSITTTMFSTIDHIDVASAGGATSVNASATLQLTAAAKDYEDNLVITPALTWTSSHPARATVDGSGLVTGAASGSVTITAQDSESSIIGTFTLTVLP
jgi:hypothetical protein